MLCMSNSFQSFSFVLDTDLQQSLATNRESGLGKLSLAQLILHLSHPFSMHALAAIFKRPSYLEACSNLLRLPAHCSCWALPDPPAP